MSAYKILPLRTNEPRGTRRLRLTRDVTQKEYGWLGRDYFAGEIVVEYVGHTYGCITITGMAVSADGGTPFFELPRDALEPVDEH